MDKQAIADAINDRDVAKVFIEKGLATDDMDMVHRWQKDYDKATQTLRDMGIPVIA